MARKRFPDETLDFAEKTYFHLVLPGFPRYAEFWEEFIGGEYLHDAGTLVPYPIICDARVPRSQRELVDSLREAIRVSHYAIFIHLVRAHQLLDRLAAPPKTDQELFEYLDSLENFYVYLGNGWMSYRDVFGASCLELASPGAKFEVSSIGV